MMREDKKDPRKIVDCPTCGKPVAWGPESKWRPFCSERCRMIDLGEWFAEEHRIVDKPEPDYP